VFGVLLAGQPTAAAIIVTAKGLLRLPDGRTKRQQSRGASDKVAEYLLIGTFSSLLLAAAGAALVSAAV
jgi:predicted permease